MRKKRNTQLERTIAALQRREAARIKQELARQDEIIGMLHSAISQLKFLTLSLRAKGNATDAK